jgi:hypothetical protein
MTWQWQILGQVDETVEPAHMFDIGLTDAKPSDRVVTVEGFGTVTCPRGINAGIIDRLHARLFHFSAQSPSTSAGERSLSLRASRPHYRSEA